MANKSSGESGCETISVEEAGQRLGIGRNSAYEAARRREIPTIRIGRRMLVPLAAFERMLDPPVAPPSLDKQ